MMGMLGEQVLGRSPAPQLEAVMPPRVIWSHDSPNWTGSVSCFEMSWQASSSWPSTSAGSLASNKV